MVEEREWTQYHTPKELLLGMVEEIGEFRNIIKWEKDDEKVRQKIKEHFAEAENFFGDMLWELCSMANYCGVDLETALDKVIEEHTTRYPVEQVKGHHTNQ